MCRTSIFEFRTRLLGFVWFISSFAVSKGAQLKLPLKELFSHSKHEALFKKNGIQCADCHNFTIQAKEEGPLAPAVPEGLIKAPRASCHQCHMGPSRFAKPVQCDLCHSNLESIKPKDHFTAWRSRHGQMAQLNQESCSRCHTPSSCKQCHMLQDAMNPSVHPGNFRLFHSVQARMKPQSCTVCHKSQSFCVDCHRGK